MTKNIITQKQHNSSHKALIALQNHTNDSNTNQIVTNESLSNVLSVSANQLNLSNQPIAFLRNVKKFNIFELIPLSKTLESIQSSSVYAERVSYLRLLDPDKYKIEKSKSFSYAFNGSFEGEVTNAGFTQSSSLFHFDIDNLTPTQVLEVKKQLSTLASCVFAFVSPSGLGLKGALRIDPERIKSDADFKAAFKQVEAFFGGMGIVLDTACKDVRRLCFASYDPAIYINYVAEVFELTEFEVIEKEPTLSPKQIADLPKINNGNYCYGKIQAKFAEAVPGNRHQTRFAAARLAGGYVSAGRIDHGQAWDLLMQLSDSPGEIKTLQNGFSLGLSEPIADPWAVRDVKNTQPQMKGIVFPDIVNKRPANTLNNLLALLTFYKLQIRYNVINKRISIVGFAQGGDLGDEANLQRLESLASLNGITDRIAKKITCIADDNPYNPITDYFNSEPWDGVSRLQDIYNTVQVLAGEEPYRDAVMRMWLLQCAAAADNGQTTPNIYALRKFEYILVFQGDQGKGKTKWVRALVDKQLDEYILDGAHLNPNNKDSVFTVISHWIVELGELDSTIKKSEVSEQKAFTSKIYDKARRPYDRIDSNYARRTSICASVNPTEFLADVTGSRRFLPIRVTNLNPLPQQFNKQQLWAEVWHLYQQGEQWWPDAKLDNWVKVYSKQHQQISNIEDALLTHFDLSIPTPEKKLPVRTCTEILFSCGREKPTKAELNETAAILRKHGFKQIDHNVRGYRVREYEFDDANRWGDV